MTRVLFLSPTTTDLDVRRHAESLSSVHGVAVTQCAAPPEDRLAYVLRGAAGIFRSRRAIDLVVTVGPSALAAANIGWRGPLVHIPVGKLGRSEASLCRGLASRDDFRLVTSSAGIVRQAMRYLADVHKVRLVRPATGPLNLERESARARLGIGRQTPLYHIVGLARPGSGHRLGLWTTSILHFRDPATRVLISTGGSNDGLVRRFARSTNQAAAVISSRHDEPELLAAPDVAICVADAAPDWSAIQTLHQAGVSIVALRSTWDRERLHAIPATLVETTQARMIARAAIEAYEARADGVSAPPAAPSSSPAVSDWSHLLQTLVPPHRTADR